MAHALLPSLVMTTLIQVRDVPERPVLLVHARFPNAQISTELGRIFGDVMRWAGQHAVTTSGPAFARFARWDGGQCELDAGFVVDRAPQAADPPVTVGHVGGCLAACATHFGPYDTVSETYASMQQWMTTNGYVPGEGMWEEYLTPPGTPPDQIRTDVFWPVKKG